MDPILKSNLYELGQSAFNNTLGYFLSQSAAKSQYNRQLEFWNMQNAYNHPSAQRNRMLQAGMNPIDNVQSLPAGELSTVPANEFALSGGQKIDLLSAIKTLSESEKIGAETDLISQELAIAVVEEALKHGELLGVQLDNEKKEILLKWLDSKEKASLDKLLADINNVNQSTATSASEQSVNEATANSINTKLPYEVDSLKAGIQLKEAQARYNDALTLTENTLRDVRSQLEKANVNQVRMFTEESRKNIEFRIEEIDRLSDADRVRESNMLIGEFFGLADISILPAELQAKASEYFWDFQHGEKDYLSTVDAFQAQINRYVDKNGRYPISASASEGNGFGFNFGVGVNSGSGSGKGSGGRSGISGDAGFSSQKYESRSYSY